MSKLKTPSTIFGPISQFLNVQLIRTDNTFSLYKLKKTLNIILEVKCTFKSDGDEGMEELRHPNIDTRLKVGCNFLRTVDVCRKHLGPCTFHDLLGCRKSHFTGSSIEFWNVLIVDLPVVRRRSFGHHSQRCPQTVPVDRCLINGANVINTGRCELKEFIMNTF